MPDLIPIPFAVNGDKTVPLATDPNGFVNFDQGYTPFYELNLASGNPAAKAVERGVQNYLFGLTTDNIAWLQRNGLPMWYSTMPNGYPKNAIVQRVATDGTIRPYRSLVAANMSDPLTTPASWEYEPTAAETLLNVPMPSGGASGPTGLIVSVPLDFNSLVTGTYDVLSDTVAAACSNAPSVLGGAILAGMLECMAWQNAGIAMIVQRYTDRAGSSFARGAVGGAWTSWNQIIDVAHGDVRYAKLNGATAQRFSVADATAPTDATSARQTASGVLGTATAGGSATAMTAAFPASPTAYTSGQPFRIISSVTNTGSMTAVLTLGGAAQASVPVVKGNNQPLSPGDFPAGYPGEFLYNAATSAIVMANPAQGIFASLGVGQTWQNVTGSRAQATTYTNSTGRAISVFAMGQSSITGDFYISVDGVVAARQGQGTVNQTCGVSAVVPPGSTYSFFTPSGVLTYWAELR